VNCPSFLCCKSIHHSFFPLLHSLRKIPARLQWSCPFHPPPYPWDPVSRHQMSRDDCIFDSHLDWHHPALLPRWVLHLMQ
jgi:hypothetical protein